jgi:serine/threonine protein kinase
MNQKITKLINKIKSSMNIELIEDDVYEIGEGGFAKVYQVVDEPYVIRIGSRRDKRSQQEMDKYIEKSKDFEHVVKIYMHFVSEKNNYELTLMESLEELDYSMENVLFNIESGDFSDGIYYFLKFVDVDSPSDIHEAIYNSSEGDVDDETILNNSIIVSEIYEHREQLGQIYTGILELESAGILHTDLHMRNIMQDENGNMKIIDIF